MTKPGLSAFEDLVQIPHHTDPGTVDQQACRHLTAESTSESEADDVDACSLGQRNER